MDLPWDIICIIMIKLPAKSLMRFQIAAKTWYDLIHDLQFRKSHTANLSLTQSSSSNSFILSRKNPEPSYKPRSSFKEVYLLDKQNQGWKKTKAAFTLNPKLQAENLDLKIISSCNGLLCLSNQGSYVTDRTRKIGVIIYNPITREGAMLPELDLVMDYDTHRPKGVNFGYDSGINKYKVAIMCSGSLMNIITVGEKSWRILNYSRWMEVNSYFQTPTATSNKEFFWFMYVEILVLDISDEKFRVITLKPIPGVKSELRFFLYEKHVTLIVTTCVEWKKSSKRIQIWELVNGTWKRQKTHDILFKQEVDVLGTAAGDRLLLKLCSPYPLNAPCEFAIYNPKTGKLSSLLSPNDPKRYDVFSFVPTLVSLKF